MENLNIKQKIIFVSIISLMILVIVYYIFTKTKKEEYLDTYIEENEIVNETEQIDEKEIENLSKNLETEEIIIHIAGAVQTEGIINLKKGERIADAIKYAGGTTINADLSKVNLAYVLLDGQKIYIPNINEVTEEINIIQENSDEIILNNDQYENDLKNEIVNINKANQVELETLPGIGPSTALKILEYRNTNGYFSNIEEIKNVSGIGQAKFEAVKDFICVE